MDQRRVRSQSGFEVGDRVELLVTHHDCVDSGMGLLKRGRGDGRHDFTLEADQVVGEQLPIGDYRAVVNVGHVVCREYGHHSGHVFGKRCVDADQFGRGDLGVFECCERHTSERHIRGVTPVASDFGLTIGSIETRQFSRNNRCSHGAAS